MSIKIQINSVEALERLIGGDTQIEIDIRNNIVQEFAKRHLKDIAESETFKGIESSIKNFMTDNFMTKMKYGFNEYEFNEEVLKKFKSSLLIAGESSLLQAVRDVSEDINFKGRIEGMLNEAARNIEHQLSDAILSKKIDELVDKKIKQKLGL
ncbi:gp279 [Sphingomonas phage PAU]|uniref:gp279 n=1 Tax=Sphingomonas phage PAU TaxID=1150991 RepID=UPI0002573496|nr:gp279 [Sphingomonas phage PAU]AFF28277.1 gp279 [Sphingomonas phage PAU]